MPYQTQSKQLLKPALCSNPCNAPYFIISLCLMPKDFICQKESAATLWVNFYLPVLLTKP